MPFFEDLVKGCFVRIGIGQNEGRSIYRVSLCILSLIYFILFILLIFYFISYHRWLKFWESLKQPKCTVWAAPEQIKD
jgi:hypothetical protein